MLRPDPPMAFGCMPFGEGADEAASAELFAAARSAGISQFDTAHLYTGGASERILGRLIRGERGLSIASKVGYIPGTDAAGLRGEFAGSLDRLRLDAIDLLYLHRDDPAVPMAARLEVLVNLQEQGLIRRIGLSNHAAWRVMQAQAILARMGSRIDAIQPMYSLVKRQAEVELLPMAVDQGMVPYTYSPLGGGLLTGKYASGAAGRLTQDARYAARYAMPGAAEAAEGLARLAADAGVHPATLAVAFVMAHPARPVPLVSARTAAQLAPSLAALNFRLEPGLYAAIAALYPAPPPATDRTEETP